MCGFFALFLNRPLTEVDLRIGRQGTAALQHRGPDGSGEWIDAEKGIFMGHRRLAIVDLNERSAQPMERGRKVIAYNGEIYNFRAVANDLSAHGYRFDTSGDVEVVLNAWDRWGADCLSRFDGMYAMAIWDAEARVTHLATDPFGEKPMFIARRPEGVYVSSELGPLAEALALKPHFSTANVAAYLSFGNFHAPDTAFPDVQRLPPATYMTIEAGKTGPMLRHWTPPHGEAGTGTVQPVPEAGLDAIAEVLTDAIEGRLVADVPLALFLSGGVDSSLVAALATAHLGHDLTCLSVSFPRGDAVDESARASLIAAHFKQPHRILESKEDPAIAGVDHLLDLMHEPHDNLSALAVHQLSSAAATEFKVCLTGMGGDELTYGYGKHHQLYRRRELYGLPRRVRTFAGAGVRMLGGVAPNKLQAARMAYFVDDWERYLALKNYPAIDGLREVPSFARFSRDAFADLAEPLYLSVPRYELTDALPNDQLIVYDHASMRASLELRTPFLSTRLAAVVAEFDPRALLAFGQKSVLRRLLARYLPTSLFDYPKSGFRFPHDVFLSRHGSHTPKMPGLPTPVAESLWQQRGKGGGWARLGVRLVAASAFAARYKAA